MPGPGDPDASGTATLTVNPGLEQVCWTIETEGIEEEGVSITVAHIHPGSSTQALPPLVDLDPVSGGCTTVSRELAVDIITNPGSYYVNVHSTEFPAGAIRGQLDS